VRQNRLALAGRSRVVASSSDPIGPVVVYRIVKASLFEQASVRGTATALYFTIGVLSIGACGATDETGASQAQQGRPGIGVGTLIADFDGVTREFESIDSDDTPPLKHIELSGFPMVEGGGRLSLLILPKGPGTYRCSEDEVLITYFDSGDEHDPNFALLRADDCVVELSEISDFGFPITGTFSGTLSRAPDDEPPDTIAITNGVIDMIREEASGA